MSAEAHTAEHHEGTRFYWVIGAVLAVVTILEVAITFAPWPHWIIVAILLILSFMKGAAVVMYYMHLKGDFRVLQLVFIVPMLLATVMLLMFLLLFSTHVGIAG
ncbi:MAG TPA: cytochrome C oxidase subunit IV family protein [Roseiflexaceae bacterium]|nr:cytochrome C oxidase subunit IV family protein [Roseiflexaceae bacterium]HMP39537.1 cytochrome C oxidase subunit IV family protein [Roseiflexaceae bacterium]